MSKTERYYPETLLGIYFNLCRSGDEKMSIEGLNKFADEIQGYYESSGRMAEPAKVRIRARSFTERSLIDPPFSFIK